MSSNAAFDQAAEDLLKLTKPLKVEQLLEVYPLFKIGKGEDIETAAAPGMFDLKAKSKRRAWQAKLDAGLTREAAQKEYIEVVEKLKVSNNYDPNKVPEKVGA